jgi:hypothetical protein
MAKRLKGDCRADLATGDLFALDGATPESCASCSAPCEMGKHASGLAGSALTFHTELISEGRVNLSWACPRCGVTVNEESPLFFAEQTAKQIEADPLCARCRKTPAA